MRRTLTAALTVASLLAITATALALVPAPGKWTGTTDQKDDAGKIEKLTFVVKKSDPRKLDKIVMPFHIDCDGGTSWRITQPFFVRANSSGKIAQSTVFAGMLGPGRRAQHGFSINARFHGRRKLKGTVDDVVLVTDDSGKQVDTCHSGSVHFTARH